MPSVEHRQGRRGNAVVRLLVLWSIVFLLVELALGLLDVDAGLLVLAGAAVLALGAYDVLRHVTMRGIAAGVGTAVGVVGVFMALDEADIAPRVVNTLFLGLVLAAAGIAIVAIGGGGVQPMRARWEQAIERWQMRSTSLRTRPRREVDLRDPRAADRAVDDTTLVPSRDGLTQERIRAEIRSETDMLP